MDDKVFSECLPAREEIAVILYFFIDLLLEIVLLSITECNVLKSSTIIVEFSVFLSILSVFLYVFWAPFLGAYRFIIVMFSCWIIPLMVIKCSNVVLVTTFVLDYFVCVVIPAIFWVLFVWYIFSHSSSFNLLCLESKVWLLYTAYIVGP